MRLHDIIRYCLIAILILFLPTGVQARDYSFPQLLINIQVEPDGSFRVTEERTAHFQGRYTGMFQWINLRDQMRISDVTVSDNQGTYARNPVEEVGPARTFYLQRQNNQVYIDWSFVAQDETRTFTIEYTVKNAIVVHDDVAELYYQFVGEQWEKGVEQVKVTLHLPGRAPGDQLRAWGHGPLHGEVTIIDEQTIEWEIQELAANTMLEGRVTFPPELVPNATVRSGDLALAEILEEEQGFAEDANRSRALVRGDILFAIILFIAGIVSAVLLYFRYGKAYRPDFTGDYFRELPQEYSPAELGVLWNMGRVTDRDLTATILDLARRKVVKLEEYELVEKGLLRNKQVTDYRITKLNTEQELLAHEQGLLELLFKQIASDQEEEVTLDQIKRYAKRHKRKFAKSWQQWQKDVKEVAKNHGFLENVTKMQVIFIVVGILLMLSAVAPFLLEMYFTGIALFGVGLIIVITGACLTRRSQAGANDYARWKAFRRFLLHFSEIPRQEVPALVLWEHYLVYAVTLGVAKQVLKQLEIVFPRLEDGDYRFGHGWYYYGTGPSSGLSHGITNMTNTVQTSFQQSIQIATSQSSSGSGAGGGFSGGGGGGFGGGGGGAR